MSHTPAPLVHVLLSVVEWEIVILALTRAAEVSASDSTAVLAGRKV